jgi:hypothetical protein
MHSPIGREFGPGQRLVANSMLPDNIVECPHCGCKNFNLVGDFHRTFEQVYEEGKAKENGLTLGAQAIQSTNGIVCKGCNIHTIIEDDEVFERDNLIFDLHTQIATLQGKVAPSPEKDWRN